MLKFIRKILKKWVESGNCKGCNVFTPSFMNTDGYCPFCLPNIYQEKE